MKRALPFVVVLLAALAVHWRALTVGFLSDEFYLPLLLRPEGVRWQQVLDDLTGPWLGVPDSENLRPGITLHYCIDAALFGAQPLGYHLANLLLHALNAGLVYALARRLLHARPWGAALAGLLFAVHPVTPEAVTWISGRVDTTTALPFLLACLLAARGSLWTFLPAAAAMLCKESAVVLPVCLVGADLVARRRWRPRGRVLVEAALLLLGYVGLRLLALRPHSHDDVLALTLLHTPGKLLALLAPAAWPEAPVWRPWLHAAAFGLVPAALLWWSRRGLVRALAALACSALLFLPAYKVAIQDGYGGTRVLYLAVVPLALVLGPALAGGSRAPLLGGLLRTGCAALWVALGATLSDGRNRVFVANSDLVVQQQRQVLAMADQSAGRGQFLAELFRESSGVIALRYDNAYLAFRRPFLPVDVPLYIGANMAIAWAELERGYVDFVGLLLAQRAGLRVGSFDPLGGAGGYVALEPGERQVRAATIAELLPTGATAEVRGDGLHLPPSDAWQRLEWQPMALDHIAFESVELLLRGATERAPVVAWFPSDNSQGQRPPADPDQLPAALALLKHWRCPCEPLAREGPRTRWLAAVGNRAGWSMQVRFRDRTSLALLVPPHTQELVLEDVQLRPFLPALDVPLWDHAAVDLAAPLRIPVGSATGSLRIVLLTPMQVMEVFGDASAGAVAVPEETQDLLRLIARLAPGTTIHYLIDALVRPKDRSSSLRRSAAGSFVLR